MKTKLQNLRRTLFATIMLLSLSLTAWGAGIADLAAITGSYQYTATEALTDGTLYDNDHILSLGGSGYSAKSTVTVGGETYTPCVQIKSNRQIAMKIACNATVTVIGNSNSARAWQIGTTSAGNDIANGGNSSTTASGEVNGTLLNPVTIYINATSDLYLAAIIVESSDSPICSATIPGNISKGANGNPLTLTAAGSPATNNTWYWQTAEDGEDKTHSGATFAVTAAGTYYIRSYCDQLGGCWSSAKAAVVTEDDLDATVRVPYFTMTVTNGYTTNLATNEDHTITASEATISGGTALVHNGKGSGASLMGATIINLGGSSASYLKITLGGTKKMKVGDLITISTANTFKLTSTNSNSSVVNTNANGKYTIVEEDLLDGANTLYVWKNGGSTFTTITIAGVELSAAATPTFTVQPVGASYALGETVVPLTATATVTDAGVVSYAWYKKGASEDTKVGIEQTYTPTETGTYYCVATNSLADHEDASAKSVEVEVTIATLSNDVTLGSLTLNGVTINGFKPSTQVYNVTLPYGVTIPVVAATANHANAIVGTITQATIETPTASFWVTAEDGTTKQAYQVRFVWAPKLGVEIIGATVKGNTSADASGLYLGSVDVNTQSDKKFGTNSYVGLKLEDGKTFATGDILEIDITNASSGGSITLYASDKSTILWNTESRGTLGLNYFVLTEALNDKDEFYVCRTSSNGWNAYVNTFKVYRQMPSMIASFTIDEADGVINQEAKTIAVTVPYGTDVTALTPEVIAYANGGATVTPTGAQDFTSAKTYTVASAYTEDAKVSYIVTVTVAEPACPTGVTITGTKNYIAGSTIELTAATDGTGAVTYQWYKDETIIEGATDATFSKTATMSDGGNYVCKVNQGTCEEVASEAYAVTVNKKAVTKVEVTSEGDVHRVRMGETLVLTATVTPADATYPEVTWDNQASQYYSNTDANPTTITPIKPGKEKAIKAIADGKQSDGFKITVYSEVTYVTYGDPIPNAEYDGNTSITLPTPTGGNEPFLGWYSDAEFTNKVGNAGMTSYKPADNITLYAKWTMPDAETPVITTQPQGKEYEYGTTVFDALTVEASPVTAYQWYKNSVAIDGATEDNYTPTEEGTYYVMVTNHEAGHNDVTVKSDNAVISVAAPAEGYTQVDITESTTWNWANAGASVDKGASASGLLANESGITNDETFNSQALNYVGRYPNRGGYFQGSSISLHTTIPGVISVQFSNTGGNPARTVSINGNYEESISSTSGSGKATYTSYVAAGDITINGIQVSDEVSKDVRIYQIEFIAEIENNTLRTLTNNQAGTICLTKGAVNLSGASFWKLVENNGLTVTCEEVHALEAGKGYIFVPQVGATEITGTLYGDPVAEPVAANKNNGLQGTFTEIAAAPDNVLVDNYLLYNNQIVQCGANCSLAANRAYIVLEEVPTEAPAKAPGVRRMSIPNANAPQTPTAIDNLTEDGVAARKVVVDGYLYIIRENKMYNANGQIVK